MKIHRITEEEYELVAHSLDCEVAAVKAVAKVEASGDGFLSDGRPKILFEGHVFWKELQKRMISPAHLMDKYPTIIYKRWTKEFYLGGAKEYTRLEKAIGINPEAALSSASWGTFQVMGYHWEDLGYKSIYDFVAIMESGELGHLEAFARYIQINGLADKLRNKDWDRFALGYNGSAYVENKYHIKIAKAYEYFSNLE